MGMGAVNVCRRDLSRIWGPVYQSFLLVFGKSEAKSLGIPPLPREEVTPTSS